MVESKNKHEDVSKELYIAEFKENTKPQQQIDNLHRTDYNSRLFCEMMEESIPANNKINNIIEESIVSIMWKKLITKKGIVCFLVYHLVILILYNSISLTKWFSILLTFVKKIIN
jgi:hypothetical protein